MENPIKIDDLARTIWLLPASLFFETPEELLVSTPTQILTCEPLGITIPNMAENEAALKAPAGFI